MKRKSGNRRASPAIHQTEIGCCLLTTSLSLYCCSTPEIAHSLSNIHAPYDMSASCVAAESDWERHRLFGEGALACEEEPLEVICLPPCHHYSFRSQTTRGRGIQNSECTLWHASVSQPPHGHRHTFHYRACTLHIACLCGQTPNAIVFTREANALALFPPRLSQCQPCIDGLEKRHQGRRRLRLSFP